MYARDILKNGWKYEEIASKFGSNISKKGQH